MGTDVTQCWRQNPLQLLSRDLVGGRGRERNCGCSIVVPFDRCGFRCTMTWKQSGASPKTSCGGGARHYYVEFEDISQPSTILIQNTPLRRPESWLLRSSGPGRTAPPRLARASLQYRPAANPDRHLLASWTAMAWGGICFQQGPCSRHSRINQLFSHSQLRQPVSLQMGFSGTVLTVLLVCLSLGGVASYVALSQTWDVPSRD